jgi:hypothetical protein
VAQSTKQRLLAMAAARVGRADLARRLSVQESLLEAWMQGVASMPDGKLAALAELIEQLGDSAEE